MVHFQLNTLIRSWGVKNCLVMFCFSNFRLVQNALVHLCAPWPAVHDWTCRYDWYFLLAASVDYFPTFNLLLLPLQWGPVLSQVLAVSGGDLLCTPASIMVPFCGCSRMHVCSVQSTLLVRLWRSPPTCSHRERMVLVPFPSKGHLQMVKVSCWSAY